MNESSVNDMDKNVTIEPKASLIDGVRSRWYRNVRLSYYVSIGFALICCISGVLFSRKSPRIVVETKDVKEKVSVAEFTQIAHETIVALNEKMKNLNREKALHLAKVTDLLQKELGEYDKQAQADALVRLSSLPLETLKTGYSTFFKELQKSGLTQEELKGVMLKKWDESHRRTILYREEQKEQLGILTKNINEVLAENPKVEILKVLNNSGMAFLVTFERPWRAYIQKEIASGKMSMLLAGRVSVGYDMRKVQFHIIEGLPNEKVKYEIKLPKPEIRDVIFDFDKTTLVRMSDDGGSGIWQTVKSHTLSGWYGMSKFFKEICEQTPENKRIFLSSFYSNNLFDLKETQENIVNVLRPYFELQGNSVVVDPTPTTFPEMMNVYLNKEEKSNVILGGAR